MIQPSSLNLLALSGSLRAKSINTAVLLAAQSLAPVGVTVTYYGGIRDLPHFNPDLDSAVPPAAVRAFRDAIDSAAVLIFCTPEYAHGVPGTLKNALDWLVSHEPFLNKPAVILNARPGADYAQASLRETLRAMNARLLESASVTLPLTSNALDAAALIELPAIRTLLVGSLAAIQAHWTQPT